MRLFSEEVTPTFTSSNLNILTVKDFYEVFFDVYELEINGKKYVAEKVSEYKGSPVVSVNIVRNNKEYTTNCVLQRGKFNFLVNEEAFKYVCDVSSVDDIILSEKEDESVFDEIIFEKHESLLEDIQEAKLSAKRYLDSLKKQQQEDINKQHAQKRKEFDTELKSIKEDLVEEFIRIANSVKSNVDDTNQATAADFKNLVNDQVLKLTKTINKNFSLQKEELEEYIDESVNTTASTIISTVLANELKASNDSLNDRVSKLYEHVNSKLTELVSEHKSITEKKLKNVIDDVDRKILSLEKASTELNDTISKNTNKALSRIGNVKTQIERSITETVSALQSDIEKASDRVRYFYDKEIEKINENVSTLNDTVRQDCIKLVSESKESLLKMISDIKIDVPNIIIEKKDGTGSEINLKKIKSELEKTISSRFTNELMSLKRMMEMMSGGGTVAQQFADGGVMNGNLTIVGAISANQYLGISTLTGDYLPLSGGTITGNLSVTGSTSVDNITFDQTPELAGGVGILRWNDEDGTLDLGLKGGNVTLQIGQEQVVRAVNKTNSNLLESEYKVVRIRSTAEGGAQGQRLAIVLAQANNDPNSVDTIGLVTENIADNQEGFVTTSGLVRNIDTTGTLQGETWVDGDVLYLSPTVSGQLTKVKPEAPNHTVIVGFVVYAHQNNGKIFVKVDNGYELDELHNVKITSVSANDILKYNATNRVWENSNSISLSSLSANRIFTNQLDALSANITVIDIKQYELSGFNVQGDATVQGSISATGSTTINGDLTVDTNTLFVDSVNNRVGVGTSTPLAKLAVNGSVNIGSNFAPYTGVYGIVVNDISGGIILNRIGANETFIRLTSDDSGGCQLRGLTAGGVRFTDRGGSNEWARITNTGNLGIGTTTPNERLTVSGNISATGNITTLGHLAAATKAFVIPHQTKPDKQLQHGCLEGPENSVYVRGTTSNNIIDLPDYWDWLVHENSVTATVTPIGKFQALYVVYQDNKKVEISGVEGKYNYTIYGTRKDVEFLEVEV